MYWEDGQRFPWRLWAGRVAETVQSSQPGDGTPHCRRVQGGCANLPIITIPINKPIFGASRFIISQSKDMLEAHSSLLKPPFVLQKAFLLRVKE